MGLILNIKKCNNKINTLKGSCLVNYENMPLVIAGCVEWNSGVNNKVEKLENNIWTQMDYSFPE